MKIAIDAMGGDFAPANILEGIALASVSLPHGVTLVLTGREPDMKAGLTNLTHAADRIEFVHADEVIEMGEHPTKALSQKPHSSIAIGFKLLKEKAVDAFCSAGNTGAMHVGAMFSIKAIDGVLRPCIAGIIPQVAGGLAVMLDIGANADCKPDVLAQFGELGSIYAAATFGMERPRVALMNIGTEEKKGSLAAQAAYDILAQNRKINFIGNIEGRDLFQNRADVIVTDGFTGNILFKLGESLYDIATERGMKDDFFDKANYEATGGSPILGVNGNVVIAHGISSPLAIKNMIELAIRQVEAQAYLKIAQAFA